MSPIIINSGTSNITPSSKAHRKDSPNKEKNHELSDEEQKLEEGTEKAREERKATGRSIAIIIFLSLMCLALYHVIKKKTTILAGVLVPALILFTYTFFVIHISNRDKKRRKQLASAVDLELSIQSESKKFDNPKMISNISNPSISSSSIPSTSGLSMNSSRNVAKQSVPSSLAKIDSKHPRISIDPKGNLGAVSKQFPPPFKKTHSQSQIQVKSNQTANAFIEHETKKLKKSRSFDKNNFVNEIRHVTDNKKNKTKRSVN
ncbi:CLUMA_CG009880, isoform A [Clunio marinus]|uniref:CLUMA_CG009880, isoform A n=1 Tax=Clunio marinus TaxID=568069 RepID=A0A1J1IAN5_9DIPT|nr:CLUMA_CG009880, isoform A [Clunio marinus]